MTDYVALKTLCRYSTPCQCGSLCHTDPDLPLRLVSKSNISTCLHHVVESAIAELSTKLGNCILLQATSILTITKWTSIKAWIFTWCLLHRMYHVTVLTKWQIFTVLGMNIMPFKITPPNVPVKWVAVSNVLYLGGPRFKHQPREHLTWDFHYISSVNPSRYQDSTSY